MSNRTFTHVLSIVGATFVLISSPITSKASDGLGRLMKITQSKAETVSVTVEAAIQKQNNIIAERRAQGFDVKADEGLQRALRTTAAQVHELEKRLQQMQAEIKKGCR